MDTYKWKYCTITLFLACVTDELNPGIRGLVRPERRLFISRNVCIFVEDFILYDCKYFLVPDHSHGSSRQNFPVDRFFEIFYCSQMMSYLCQKCTKDGSHRPRFRDKARCLQGFIVRNIDVESTKAHDLSHILYKWVCSVNNFKCCQRFLKT